MSVSIKNAHKFYNKGRSNEIHVINGVNLELPESGMVAVFGRSGCGKTTLLNAIGGLDGINSGSITLFGEDIREKTEYLRNKYVGYIFQNYNLSAKDTVFENVAMSLRLCGMEDEEEIKRRVMSSLANVGMDKFKNRTPDTLSGGQMQRVAIARALVKAPSVILADEPTGNLDEYNTVKVMDILKEVSKEHLVILVTHEANLVDYYCDKVIELVDGRVVSERENASAGGYIKKDKNSVYLGELEHKAVSSDRLRVDFYGDPVEEIKLRIVSIDGRLYLKSDTPSLRFLDESSEVKLVEGVFEEKPQNSDERSSDVDISALTPFEGGRYGRLFRFWPSFRDSLANYYTTRKKKGKRFLRVCLALLAVVFIFVASVTAVNIKDYVNIRSDVNENEFLIPYSSRNAADLASISDQIGEHGIDYVTFSDYYGKLNFFLSPGRFVTASAGELEADLEIGDAEWISGKNALCGRTDIKDPNDVILTSAAADAFIESSGVSYVNDYEDIIGLTFSGVKMFGSSSSTVVGVFESDEKYIYFDSLVYAEYVVNRRLDSYGVIGHYSQVKDLIPSPEKGEIVVYNREDFKYRGTVKGDKLSIGGREFVVKSVVEPAGEYIYYINDGVYATVFMNDEDYKSLYHSFGKSDGDLLEYDELSLYIRIHSSDVEETAKYLRENSARYVGVVTPDEFFEHIFGSYRTSTVASFVSLAVIAAMMCVCAYFIMRSIFMARVKEVGIYRAIGVSKKNMLFRFGIESLVLCLGTVFIGYVISAFIMAKLSSAAMFDKIFYFPPWFALILLVLVMSMTLFFGVLPAIALLRKTPSEILSKYDI